MSDSRINRLSQLFESKNRILRLEAAQQLAQFPLSNEQLRQTLRKGLCSPVWESRATSAHSFGLLLERLAKEVDRKVPNFNEYEPKRMQNLDLDNLLTHFKVLVSCEEVKIESKKENTKLSSKEQRRLVDQHLDMSAQTGISSRLFIGEEDFGADVDQAETSSGIMDPKEELSNSVKSESQESKIEESETESSVRVLSEFIGQILCDLASAVWQQRHGASMALCKIITYALPMLPQQDIEMIAVRAIQVLALDRFNDFATGANAVAPVRETLAQAISILMLKIGTDCPLVKSVIGQLQVLMLMTEEKNWPCRQTALIVLKYFFSMCSSSEEFSSLFDCAVEAMRDEVDEVISTAVYAVSSLFSNERVELKDKNSMVKIVMEIVWQMLLDEDAHNLMDGISSLLNDLLGIIQTWLCVETQSVLNLEQFRHIVNLFDPNQITTTVRSMECVYLTVSKGSNLGDEEIFLLIKMLYRCILFVQVSDAQKLLELSFATLIKLISVYDETRLASIKQLHTTIGLWIGCLSYDYKNSEIDVFLHNVDGPNSNRNQTEMICSDEARFLDGPTKNTTFMDRKCLAARFLSPLIDVLYRSNVQIQDQPLHLSLQLHFIPYLQTNSLHQRLGIALILNCWSRMFRRAYQNQKNQEYPTLLVQVLASILNEANSQRSLYDEVSAVVGVLTNECNEFRRHCLQKGVSSSQFPIVDTPNMENVVEALYEECKKYLTKPADLEALDGRKNYLIQLINATKLEIRTNTNRLNCLCASILFYLGHLPQTLTPMIRPLIDATESENNERLSEECFYDSFPILLAATLQRQPCPHAKILKQLATGLVQDEKFAPKSVNFNASTSQESLVILSAGQTSPPLQPTITKTRNCQVIIRQLGQQLGASLFQICPELINYLKLDSMDLSTDTGMESFLCNVDFVRLLSLSTQHRPSHEEIQILINQLSSSNPAVRFRIARLIAELATTDLCFVLNAFFEPIIVDGGSKIDDNAARGGAVELILLLTQHLNAKQLISVASLLAPKSLALISDSLECIRELASQAFGRLVSLLHLQNTEQLPSLSEALQKQLEESRDFVNVLSAPSSLQSVSQSDIPGLRSDINLRAYQLEGITWLTFLSRFSLNGILADDMGLGKTLQTLSLLAIERKKGSNSPTLIVCPRTLATHWTKEWHNYFPNEKLMLKFGENGVDPSKLTNTDNIIVISYEEIRSNIKKFNCISWKFVVLDEGHCIRNPNTQMFEAIMSLRAQHRLLLSGTPVQNSPADLWALFRFLMPGYLFTQKVFNSKFLRPIIACRNTKASDQQTKDGEEVLAQLHRLILPFVLRRLKTDVLKELPDKVIQECTCQLTDVQAALYAAIVEKCSLAKKDEEGSTSTEARLSPLATLIALRQLVDHPIMIREFLHKIGWTNRRIFDLDSPKASNIELSGKLMALKELLQECQIGDQPKEADELEGSGELNELPNLCQHRALIFCQWRASVDLIAKHLDNQSLGSGIRYLRLDGTVPVNERQTVVDRFNNDPSIDLLLVTTHVGGVGLTLTGADVVIFLDHDFNPIKDLQAVDRAHRLGQTKTVNVYRLITQGTIEEKIMRFQKFKLDTANALVGADNQSISSMATDDLLELFNLSDTQGTTASTSNDEPTNKKRRRKGLEGIADSDQQFSMEELWDSSQYDDQHSIRSFIEKTGL